MSAPLYVPLNRTRVPWNWPASTSHGEKGENGDTFLDLAGKQLNIVLRRFNDTRPSVLSCFAVGTELAAYVHQESVNLADRQGLQPGRESPVLATVEPAWVMGGTIRRT